MDTTISLADIEIITSISDSKKSTVSLAFIKNTKEPLVLKEYHETDSAEFFYRLQTLESEFFPKIYHVWEENSETIVLEEYISGKTLQQLLANGCTLQEKDMTLCMTALCRALLVLHNARPPIIHRDIKPENIIITPDNKLKLVDFDAAREYKTDQKQDTVLLGTKEYASPEQFGFMQTDIRSDIYSFGIVFSELLEHAQVSKQYTKRAHRIIDRATMFDPDKRYSHSEELLKDIQHLNRPALFSYAPIIFLLGLAAVSILTVPDRQNRAEDAIFHTETTPSAAPTATDISPSVSPKATAIPVASTEAPSATAIPIQAGPYQYTSIEREFRQKNASIESTHSELYNGVLYYDGSDSGFYKPDQETIIGKEFVTMRFLRAYPRDIRVSDARMEGLSVIKVSYRPYLEDLGTSGNMVNLSDSDFCQEYGNVVSVSSDFLLTLEPGAYTFYIYLGNGSTPSFIFGYYLIVHDESETVDNFRIQVANEISYYSSKSQNDVIFHINNTPYPIQQVQIGNRILTSDEFDLMNDGFSIVFHADLLEQYTDLLGTEIIMTTENGKQAGVRIINLKNF